MLISILTALPALITAIAALIHSIQTKGSVAANAARLGELERTSALNNRHSTRI